VVAGVQRRQVLALFVAVLALLTYGATANTLQTPPETSSLGDPGEDDDDRRPDVNISAPDGDSDGERPDVAVSQYAPRLSPLVLAALGLVMALVVGVLWFGSGRGDGTSDDVPPEETTIDAPTRATGGGSKPTDIVYDTDPDNEVYRAWLEMIDRLDLERTDATTPQEYADRARRAGVDAEAVTALTEAFERVRYGRADPEELADRARQALDRIEGGAA
jgi:hypothetical protein